MGSQVPGASLHNQSYSYYGINFERDASRFTKGGLSETAPQPSKSKAAMATAYPSPADEVKHSITPASPARTIARAPSPEEQTLPSLREILQRPMSPSTSPHMTLDQYTASSGSLSIPAPKSRDTSGNPYAGNTYHTADPQLFPDGIAATTASGYHHEPLFPLPEISNIRGRTPFKAMPRRRKCTPHQTPLPHPLELPRPARMATMSMLANVDPAQWFIDRRLEDEQYWPSIPRIQKTGGSDLSRGPSSQGVDMAATQTSNKRKLSRQDSGALLASSKKARVARGEGHTVTRSSPREVLSSFFNSADASEPLPKPTKAVVKHAATTAQATKKAKPVSDEADTAYTLYDDTCPDVSTLDKGLKFTANWSGKPLNLDSDPNRGLLHVEEIRLASKLALTCARYLYLKRRFYAGRLDFARKSQLYNINAAQQQCKGQDVYGVVGADVNKTSSMWKAFSSVGWLEPSHMQRYL